MNEKLVITVMVVAIYLLGSVMNTKSFQVRREFKNGLNSLHST